VSCRAAASAGVGDDGGWAAHGDAAGFGWAAGPAKPVHFDVVEGHDVGVSLGLLLGRLGVHEG
jgi:hypothetical protein